MLIQGLTGLMAATGPADGPPVPAGAGFQTRCDEHGLWHPVCPAVAGEVGKGQQIKINLMAGMMAHQMQKVAASTSIGILKDQNRDWPSRHGCPFGTYPTSDGWVTIAMSPLQGWLKH